MLQSIHSSDERVMVSGTAPRPRNHHSFTLRMLHPWNAKYCSNRLFLSATNTWFFYQRGCRRPYRFSTTCVGFCTEFQGRGVVRLNDPTVIQLSVPHTELSMNKMQQMANKIVEFCKMPMFLWCVSFEHLAEIYDFHFWFDKSLHRSILKSSAFSFVCL